MEDPSVLFPHLNNPSGSQNSLISNDYQSLERVGSFSAGSLRRNSGSLLPSVPEHRVVVDDEDTYINEIDELMQNSAQKRAEILEYSSDVLKAYREMNKEFEKQLKELPISIEKYDELVKDKKKAKKISEESEDVLQALLALGDNSKSGAHHALNFHLNRFQDLDRFNEINFDENEAIKELEAEINREVQEEYSFCKPMVFPSMIKEKGSVKTNLTEEASKESRRSRSVKSNTPSDKKKDGGYIPPNPYDPKELRRKYKCRDRLFRVLEESQNEEESLLQDLEETDETIAATAAMLSQANVEGSTCDISTLFKKAGAMNLDYKQAAMEDDDDSIKTAETTIQEAYRRRNQLKRKLNNCRTKVKQEVSSLFSFYQTRLPNNKDEDKLKALEAKLKLPTLQSVMESIKSTIIEEEESWKDREGITSESSMANLGYLDEHVDEEEEVENEYSRRQEETFENDDQKDMQSEEEDFEDEFEDEEDGNRQISDEEKKEESFIQDAFKVHSSPKIYRNNHRIETKVISGPAEIDRDVNTLSTNINAINESHISKEEAVNAAVDTLPVIRPRSSSGKAIDRGIKGKIADHTQPLDLSFPTNEIYHREEMNDAPYLVPGMTSKHIALQDPDKPKTPQWLETRRIAQKDKIDEAKVESKAIKTSKKENKKNKSSIFF